jgi:hypothetical protein
VISTLLYSLSVSKFARQNIDSHFWSKFVRNPLKGVASMRDNWYIFWRVKKTTNKKFGLDLWKIFIIFLKKSTKMTNKHIKIS